MRAHHRGIFALAIVALVVAGCGGGRRALMPSARGAMSPRPEGASRVVFVGRCAAWNVRVVDEAGDFVGDCAGDLWWTIDLPPGHHAFTAWWRGEAPAHLEADLEPDRTYHVLVHVSTNGRPVRAELDALRPSDDDWRHLSWWMRSELRTEPDRVRADSLLAPIRERFFDRIEEGEAAWSAMREPERRRHTLRTFDGAS